jgi:hypothetical protein
MENKGKFARFSVLAQLFILCAIALVYRSILFIALAYSVTVVLFAVRPYRNLLKDKGIMFGFVILHAFFLLIAFFGRDQPTGVKLLLLIVFFVVYHLFVFKKRPEISSYL